MATKIVITPELDEEKLREQLDKLKNQKEKIKVDLDTENINSANQNMKKLNSTVSNSNTIFSRLKNTIGNTFSTGKLAMTGYLAVLNEINKAGKNAKQTINDLDKAITDLSVATNMSRESVSGLVRDYNNYAKELKSTTTQITSAADDYLRAGKSMGEAQALIKDSIMLSKLGQLESGTATEDLLAVMNGYEMSIEEVGKALDAMVALDMAAATSSGDIATALKYCASSADVAGLSFNKLAAMITTVQDKTQQSAETIGTFMNTLLSRYRDVKIGQFVSDDGEDLSDVEAVLNSLDIQLRDSSQEFRDFETVIEEVALSWDSYSSVQQAAIAKAFSGTRQQNRFLALMEGYAKTLELTEVAANSAGTAIEKFNNSYMNSLEAKQNALQASFESLIMNSDFSEVYAGIIEATTALVDFINQTNALKGALTGLTVAGGIKGFLAIKTGVNEAYIALNKFQNALNIVKKSNISTKEYERLLLLSNELSTSQMKLVLSTNSLTVAQKKELLMASGLSEEEAILQLQTWKMTAANTGLTASTVTLGNAFKALWSTLIANPLVIVTALISGAVMAYQAYNQKLEETRRKNIESATAASENADALKDLYNEYKRLASIQDRTTSEEESFKTAVENITVALGDKAKVLENLTAGTDEYAEALARVTKEELQSQAVAATIGRKLAEEALQSEIWDKWKGSQVTIDSNSKGKALSDEAQKAVDIISDSLKEFETINRTWNNISWDISSDDPTKALEFYNSLVEAREKLVLASEDDEALLDTEIYEDLNTVINTMSESLDTYIEKLYEEEKLNYMAQNGIPSVTEEYKAMESALVSVAGSSVDLQDRFKELLMSDFSDLATNIGTVSDAVNDASAQAQSAIPLFTQLTSSEEALDKFQASVKSATEAYSTLLSGNYSVSELLDSIQAINQAVTDMGGSLNWEFINSQTDSLELLGDAIQNISQKYAESILSDVGIDINSEFGQMLANIIEQIYDAEAAFESMNSQLDNLQSSYQTLTGILESYNETGYISLDNLQSLLTADENLIQMLEVENGQLVLNQAAYENLVAVQLLEFKTKLNDAAAAEIESLAKQKAEQATNQNADASQNAVGKLDAETAAFNRNTTAAIANAVAKAEESGVSEAEIQDVFDKYTEIWNSAMDNYNLDFDGFMSGGKSAASKAGKEAGDAYLDAFKEEYDHLKDQLNRGEISEAQYLNKLRALYTKYFKDRKKYLDEYKKYESEYLSGMLDLHNKALSGISTLLNHRISAANDAKSAALDAISEEKEARLDAINAEKEARLDLVETKKKELEAEEKLIDKQIAAKNKIIDGIREEIDAMRSANEQKKQAINLQQDEYNLQRMLNQRTKQVYKDGQFVFETDTSGVREAKQKVEDDKLEIEISNKEKEIKLIEKEIDLLNEKKDAISEQISLLDEEIDRINDYYDEMIKDTEKYYDNLIKQQEKYWDEIIKGMEQTKSRYEELAEVEEIAKAFSYIQQVFGDLGYTVEDVLNGSDAAFEDFKSRYISVINDMNSNSDFTDGLVYATGVAKENLGSFLDKTKETAEGLDELGEKGSEMDSVADGIDKISDSATSASTSTEGLSDNLSTINDTLTAIPEADKFNSLTTSFTNLGDAIKGVADALGIGESGTVSGLVSALQEISTLSIDGVDGSGGIITQFQTLKSAVEDVTNAISGGGSSGGDASSSSSASMSAGAGGEGASGLVGAIEEFKSATDEALGGGSGEGEGSEGGGTGAIPQFEELKTAVDDVTAAIGSGDSEGGSSGDGESDNLIGSIVNLGETSEETLGEPDGDGIIGKFNEFKGVIEEAANQVRSISDGLDEIDGKEVECTITVNVKMNGSIPAFASGTVLGNMQIESATYNAQYGKAFASGTIGLPHAEKNALVSEYGQTEMTVLPDGKTIITDTPTLMDLPKDTVIYNEEETKKIMDNKVDVSGNAHADGTEGNWWIGADGHRYRDLQPGDRAYELQKAFEPFVDKILKGEMDIVSNAVFEGQKQMEKLTQHVENINNITNNQSNIRQPVVNHINVTCPGVTEQQVAERIGSVLGKELDKQFSGFHNYADQMSRIR